MKFLKEEILLSERRACQVIEMDRKSFRYQARPRDSEGLLAQVRAIAEKHPTYGYRRVHAILAKGGIRMNLKRLRRIYVDERLHLRKRRNRVRHKLVKNPPPDRVLTRNALWRMDFMFDKTHSGERLKILTIIDQHTRFCPGLFVKSSFGVRDLMFALEAAMMESGKPRAIASDNGIEFVHEIIRYWAKKNGIELFYIKPGRPVENAFIESFNARLRDECLTRHAFESVEEAEEVLEKWRQYYNEERPHSSLGNLSPTEFMKQSE